jgi:2-oxoglutarate dehydrogenase E1 component
MNPVNLSERANAALVEEYYQRWLDNPESVDAAWRAFFQGFALGADGRSLDGSAAAPAASGPVVPKQSQVDSLIYHYRAIGHIDAHLNPLGPAPAPSKRLALEAFGLTEADLDTEFEVGHYLSGGRMKLRDIVAALRETYCGSIGVEYVHMQDTEQRRWLQERMEPSRLKAKFSKAQKLRILRRLHKAELFEKFLHTKYVGQKRFSLEGGETVIAALDAVIDACPELGVKEIVMGMAHRGRLNVLCSTLRKSFDDLFEKFSENYIPDTVAGDGDVKYHLGYEAILTTTSGKKVEVRLAPNPSHLEIVNPVVEGKARARQRIRGDMDKRTSVMPLLIHGDAAVAGQGIVAETLNFSQLPGYTTGGTVHFVINNQIGFTTDPHDSRSTKYCTDVAKMIEAPIFHVNGDDPEAVCLVAQLALEYRVQFGRDVFVDMYCYRKHGHNETDEPSFTQPRLYKEISAHPLVSALYTQRLTAEGSVTAAECDQIKAEYTAALEEHLEKAKAREAAKTAKRKEAAGAEFKGSTAEFQPSYSFAKVETKVSAATVERVIKGLTTVPEGFKVHPKIKRFIDARAEALKSGGPFDWGTGEALAFATLMLEGTPVRLSGQDCERGTFSHRHAVWSDVETGQKFSPFKHLDSKQGRFCVYNSLLSENAVLGFDYGYSLDYPEMLCLWEAQFGDFANGAQVVIDQFLVSGESKWQRVSGIVLLLPHGYEGQGPEHSSARLERFLQACAEDNIQVANCTTPAQFFHLLRRQMRRDFRKPLVVMSPKSLLRHPAAVSHVDDFTKGAFEEILDDTLPKADRVVLCSGKVYYDLADYRAKNGHANTALIRVEQLYPLHQKRLAELAKKYAGAKVVWAQEEPENMGAARWIMPQLEQIFGRKPVYAGRPAAASPAVGTLAKHRLQLNSFLKEAFTL